MSARDNILSRVRDAVRVKAPRPAEPSASAIWPLSGEAEARFREEFTALRGEIVESLPEFLDGFAKIATDGSELAGAGNASVREADLGVTACECLVAQTGSIIVACRSAEERALSSLPPVHLVVARRSQIVLDLDTALGLLRERYGNDFPGTISVISGPSRTADIEKVLVLGAHGPKRLALHLING
ncbi:MAG: hypothetical protein FJ395_11250 [Verrucomicrobia bacterium]|nr:hypothetical protein [Verrucomicrobiota bacterium]